MILLLCSLSATAQDDWSLQLDQLESTVTTLKKSLISLQIELSIEKGDNIPVAPIISISKDINLEFLELEKQINQIDN